MKKSFKQAEVSEASIENKTEGNILENIQSVFEVLKKKNRSDKNFKFSGDSTHW